MAKVESDSTEVEKDQLTVAQAGRRGGQSTLEHRGIEFFREIGAKGGRKTAELYHDLLKEFGKKGGRPRRPALDKPVGSKIGIRRRPAVGPPISLPPEL